MRRVLLKTAVRDDNPVLVLECELLYSSKGMVEPLDQELLDSAGRSRSETRRQRRHSHLLCADRSDGARRAAQQLEDEDISAEVLDLRSIKPLDEKAIFRFRQENTPGCDH